MDCAHASRKVSLILLFDENLYLFSILVYEYFETIKDALGYAGFSTEDIIAKTAVNSTLGALHNDNFFSISCKLLFSPVCNRAVCL